MVFKTELLDLSADLSARMTLIAMQQAQMKDFSMGIGGETGAQSKFLDRFQYTTILSEKIFKSLKVTVVLSGIFEI